MKSTRVISAMFFASIHLLLSSGVALSVNLGDPFPLFTLNNNLAPEECFYLGIECERDFAIDDLLHDIIIIEFLNVYCHTCREQVDVFNELYSSIENDPVLSENVCLLGIAVGNSAPEVKEFKENFGAFYPVLSDPRKAVFKMTGNIQGTPHTYILRREEKHYIIDYHAGGASSKDRYLATIKLALRSRISGVKPGNKVQPYSFASGGKYYDEKSFEGQRVILYFPNEKKYPLNMDARNTENQIAILHKINKQFPKINIIVFQYPEFPAVLRETMKASSVYTVERPDEKLMHTFGSPNRPTVYYINEFARIGFKGDSITLYNVDEIVKGKEYAPKPVINEAEITALIERQVEKLGKKIIRTEKLFLESGDFIYVTFASPRQEGIYFFSRLEIRPSLCDVCHDSHFIYILDQQGIIRDFIPIQMTKQDNMPWSDEDINKIKKNITGKSIFETFPFNPKVDAVTAATMSTSLVFEALNEGGLIFGEFKDYKFRSEYWKQVCFRNICKIKQAVKKKTKAMGIKGSTDKAAKEVLSEIELSACPLRGEYLVLDSDILCSVHGFNTNSCSQIAPFRGGGLQ